MTVLNLFLKLPFGYCAFGLMEMQGGNPAMLLQPELAVAGGGMTGSGGPGGEHERIADI